jgi:hypothetical protein
MTDKLLQSAIYVVVATVFFGLGVVSLLVGMQSGNVYYIGIATNSFVISSLCAFFSMKDEEEEKR